MKRLNNTRNKGMVQYFYHSPSSKFPIRDVLNEQRKGYKTEPHIEIGAENFCVECYQNNIKKFVERKLNYLFLITTCKNKEVNRKYGKDTNQFIVGYIKKSDVIDVEGRIERGIFEANCFSFLNRLGSPISAIKADAEISPNPGNLHNLFSFMISAIFEFSCLIRSSMNS